MKRDFIEAQLKDKLADGITPKEIIDAIMAENGKDIEGLKADVEKLKGEKEAVEAKLTTATESLKNFEGVDADKLNAKIEELNKELKAKDKEFADKIAGMEFDRTVEAAVTKAGGKNAKAIKALLDLEELKGSKEQSSDIEKALNALKESDAYLFESEEPINNPTGPTGGGGDKGTDDLRAAMGLE